MKYVGLVLAFLLLSTLSVRASILYTVIDLGSLDNSYSWGYGLSDNAQATGFSGNSVSGILRDRAFLYTDGQMTDLGALTGNTSIGVGINDAGQVAGYAYTVPYGVSPAYRAFLYSDAQMTDLGTLGGDRSQALAVNNEGEAVGWADAPNGHPHAFLYSNGIMTDLGTGDDSFAFGINSSGQILLWIGTRSFLYANGQLTEVGDVYGQGLNDSGQVVGRAFSTAAGAYHAFLYTQGQIADLGTLGGPGSEAYGINNAGQIVGQADVAQYTEHAFLFSDGQMLDLNDLVDPALGLSLVEARAINNDGQILANGGGHAYLLTPIPEPGMLALFGLALLAVAVRLRAR